MAAVVVLVIVAAAVLVTSAVATVAIARTFQRAATSSVRDSTPVLCRDWPAAREQPR